MGLVQQAGPAARAEPALTPELPVAAGFSAIGARLEPMEPMDPTDPPARLVRQAVPEPAAMPEPAVPTAPTVQADLMALTAPMERRPDRSPGGPVKGHR